MYHQIKYDGNKEATYERIYNELEHLLGQEDDWLVKMVTINSILKDTFPYMFWVGFYLVK